MRRRLGARALVLSRPDLADPGVQYALTSTRPEVLLSWFWPKRIPAALLALPARGAFGVHPSLLPRWRGPDPYFWAIRRADRETGVSLHALQAEYDTGALVEQRRLTIDPRENAWSLARRLDRLGLPLLVDAARRLAQGETLAGTAQDPAAVTQAPPPEERELVIDWNESADEIARLVRAAAPYPGASAELGEALVEVLEARPIPPLPSALAPAEAALLAGQIAVQTGRGALVLERVRDEAGKVLRGAAIRALFPAGLSVVRSASADASGKNKA